MVGLTKEKPWKVVRGTKTIFFHLTMSFSLLLFSFAILLLLADALLPAALFSITLSATPLSYQLRSYVFRHSLADVPIISVARSAAIHLICYLCDGPGLPRAPYLAVTTVCSLLSLVVVGMKVRVFWERVGRWEGWAVEALFLSSVVLAVAHVVAAYRTSWRERRKLLVYEIDVEASKPLSSHLIVHFNTGGLEWEGANMGEESKECHVLHFPMPFQGHINPNLQFGKRLAHKGIRVSLLTTIFHAKSLPTHIGSIKVEAISDGFDDGFDAEACSDVNFLETFKTVGSKQLFDLLQKLGTVTCLVYDSLIPWALDVAKEYGIVAASFFTQSSAVDLIFYNVLKGSLAAPPSSNGAISLPGLPLLHPPDLPSFVLDPNHMMHGSLDFILGQFSKLDEADFIVLNTFQALEDEELSWMRTQWKVMAVGPTVPSMYLDKQVQGDVEYGHSLLKYEEDVWKDWLHVKEVQSVVYVSFGSLTNLESQQMEEVACGLKQCNHSFLWVVRASEESKLPPGFAQEVASTGKGLIVKWVPQLEVLAHEAVGCFVTHCGWNSTMEGLSLGVPMVAFPRWADQPTNAKYIEEVWKVGVRVRGDEKGFVGREEVVRCVAELMDGETREKALANALRWRELAVEAMLGGSSDKDLEEIVAAIRR